jgi:hypothetical protein
LSASAITNLFLTGVGLQVQGAPDGNGNLNLNWIPSLTLQSAPSVTGPFTDVLNATPPYTTPIIGNQQFFRARY